MNEIIKKNGVSLGITYGIIGILFSTIIYVVNFELFTSGLIAFIKFILFLGFSIYLLSKTKKEIGILFTFKDAFTTYFIFAVIGLTIAVIFELILFNFIDLSIKDSLKEIVLKKGVNAVKMFTDDKKIINEAIKKMSSEDQYSIGNFIQGHFFKLLMATLFGFILAAIFKTKSSQND
jgi:hypothetical protein